MGKVLIPLMICRRMVVNYMGGHNPMVNISFGKNRQDPNAFDFSLIEGMYKGGNGVGIQINEKVDEERARKFSDAVAKAFIEYMSEENKKDLK